MKVKSNSLKMSTKPSKMTKKKETLNKFLKLLNQRISIRNKTLRAVLIMGVIQNKQKLLGTVSIIEEVNLSYLGHVNILTQSTTLVECVNNVIQQTIIPSEKSQYV